MWSRKIVLGGLLSVESRKKYIPVRTFVMVRQLAPGSSAFQLFPKGLCFILGK
jgi:hypothetical protein